MASSLCNLPKRHCELQLSSFVMDATKLILARAESLGDSAKKADSLN